MTPDELTDLVSLALSQHRHDPPVQERGKRRPYYAYPEYVFFGSDHTFTGHGRERRQTPKVSVFTSSHHSFPIDSRHLRFLEDALMLEPGDVAFCDVTLGSMTVNEVAEESYWEPGGPKSILLRALVRIEALEDGRTLEEAVSFLWEEVYEEQEQTFLMFTFPEFVLSEDDF